MLEHTQSNSAELIEIISVQIWFQWDRLELKQIDIFDRHCQVNVFHEQAQRARLATNFDVIVSAYISGTFGSEAFQVVH